MNDMEFVNHCLFKIMGEFLYEWVLGWSDSNVLDGTKSALNQRTGMILAGLGILSSVF